MSLSKLWNTETFLELALPALTTLFGLQSLRVLLPSFVWYLGDTVGVSSIMLGAIALGAFAVSFLVAPFYRALGLRRAVVVALVGIALMRLLEQVATLPVLDLLFSLLGVVLFTFFIPLYLAHTRVRGGTAPRKFGRGFLLGFVFDTTLHGSFLTLDLSWQSHSLAPIIVVLLVAAHLWLVARLPVLKDEPTEPSFLSSLPLAAAGPFVFVTQVVFQNVARATTLTGFPMPLAYAFIILVSAIGISAALLPIVPERATVFAVLVATGFLAWLTSRPAPAPSVSDLIFLFGNLLMFPYITLIFVGLGSREEINKGITRSAIANGIGWLLFGVLALLYYVSYEINIGIPNTWLPPFAVVLIGLAVIGALRTMPHWAAAHNWTSATVAFALFIVPLVILQNWREPQPIVGKGFPVRVMTYNLHNGFNTNGRLDPEALARMIEQAAPDIVGLQEVERGWYIDGSLDLAMWLSRRLQMPYVFGPTADRVWGSVILSGYPIKEWGNVPLPPRNLPLKRGFLWARIDVGGGEEVLFVATHFHHIHKDTEIRQQQSPEIVKFWAQRPRTILLGDFNAEPDSKEIQMIREAGLKDALAEFGKANEKTWPADKPTQRLDYIWFSPDLTVRDLVMPRNTASDHLGIAVTVEKK